jgi:hypothetical protein
VVAVVNDGKGAPAQDVGYDVLADVAIVGWMVTKKLHGGPFKVKSLATIECKPMRFSIPLRPNGDPWQLCPKPLTLRWKIRIIIQTIKII